MPKESARELRRSRSPPAMEPSNLESTRSGARATQSPGHPGRAPPSTRVQARRPAGQRARRGPTMRSGAELTICGVVRLAAVGGCCGVGRGEARRRQRQGFLTTPSLQKCDPRLRWRCGGAGGRSRCRRPPRCSIFAAPPPPPAAAAARLLRPPPAAAEEEEEEEACSRIRRA